MSSGSSESTESGKRRGGGGGGAGCRGGGRGGATTVPTHALLHGTGGRGVGDGPRFPLLFPSFVIYFLSGQAWVEAKGELATCRHRAESGRENGQNVRRHSLDELNASPYD